MRYRYWISTGACIILGLILVTAGVGKLLGQTETFRIFYTLPTAIFTPPLINAVSLWLPSIELIIGLLLIIGIAVKLMATFSSVLIAAFIASNSWLLSHGLGPEPCDCFGILDRIFQGELSTIGALYLDIGMLALALAIIFSHPGKLLTVRPWFLRRGRDAKE